MKQKIVIFHEKCDDKFDLPSKSTDLFMNLFAIDENYQFEVLNINKIETVDQDTIFPILKSAIGSCSDGTQIHFVFGLRYFYRYAIIDKIEEVILSGVQKFKLKAFMLTFLGLRRERLITKETMVDTCKGKLKNNYEQYKQSMCDDLESLMGRIVNDTQDMDHERTYYLPKVNSNSRLSLLFIIINL